MAPIILFAFALSLPAAEPRVAPAIPIFPGLDPATTALRAGRAGRVLEVTNLQNRGPGSLRAALEASGPRTIVFRTTGVIALLEPLRITQPFVTVAGQTAPGARILITGAPLTLEAHDVALRSLDFERGKLLVGREPAAADLVRDRCVLHDLRFVDSSSPAPRLAIPVPIDSDHDGMPDAWERRHGLNPDDPGDGPRDADRDGYTNLEEFLNGTDPRVASSGGAPPAAAPLPNAALVARHVAYFNAMEDEPVVNLVPNTGVAAWLQANIPRFECPDAEFEEIYYFRWWSLRKHLRKSADGQFHVFTEFINRASPVSSALGHHLMEGRWLHDSNFHDDYARYWLRGAAGKPIPQFHNYSQWFAAALLERYLVNRDRAFVLSLLDELVADYRQWEQERGRPDGLFWQFDVRDAMEESISGSRTKKNIRPTLNSYMFANAQAIAAFARLAQREDLAREFDAKAIALRRLTQETLWHADAKFFEVRLEDGAPAAVREAIGFIPWYFHLPEPNRGYEAAWAQFNDPAGFRALFGLTTAERRHPAFRSHGIGSCEWDGAAWPFATSQTLTALANVLRDYPQDVVTRRDYFDALVTFARSQHYEGKPYVGEYLDESTGVWLKGKNPRSRWYHHSTFADLVIAQLVGLRPRADDALEVHPLLPDDAWPWFALDDVRYHGRTLTILWDRDGTRYGRGKGLIVLADGNEVARSEKLERVTATLAAK